MTKLEEHAPKKTKFRFSAILQLMRPHQYLKNTFVFIGPVFAHQLDGTTLLQAFLAFIAFCLTASAVYVLNDLSDLEADRAHPLKKTRPLAAGTVSKSAARMIYVALALAGITLAFCVSSWVAGFALAYLVINVLYSHGMKHVVILDVFTISAGFMLRIMAGTVGLGIEPSAWLLLCGLMLTLFLGFSKRRAELLLLDDETMEVVHRRAVLDEYSPAVLDLFIAVTASCTIIAYGFYTVSPQTIALHGDDRLVYTLPFVAYGILRYILVVQQRSKGNDVARDLLTDRHLVITGLAWIITTIWILA